MTVAEKKIEMVQRLLLLEDKAILFEIDRLIAQAFQSRQNDRNTEHSTEGNSPMDFEEWMARFENEGQSENEDEFGMTPVEFRKRIWAAEQSDDMSLETFWKRVAQN